MPTCRSNDRFGILVCLSCRLGDVWVNTYILWICAEQQSSWETNPVKREERKLNAVRPELVFEANYNTMHPSFCLINSQTATLTHLPLPLCPCWVCVAGLDSAAPLLFPGFLSALFWGWLIGRAMQNTMNIAVNTVRAITVEPKCSIKPGVFIGLNEMVYKMQCWPAHLYTCIRVCENNGTVLI